MFQLGVKMNDALDTKTLQYRKSTNTILNKKCINKKKSTHSDVTTMANQTEIIYSVFVDGVPVLATTAAEDMRLVTENEVSQVMNKMVYTKAERIHNITNRIANYFLHTLNNFFSIFKRAQSYTTCSSNG